MSLATFITNAVTKVSADETYANIPFATAEDARANFVAALLFEMGLGPKPVFEHKPAEEPKEKAPKKRAAKSSKTAQVAEAAVAILEEVKAPEVEALAEKVGQLALDEQPKPKKARKTKAKDEGSSSESETNPKAPAANAAAAPEKKKPGPKPKAKSEGPVNLEKLTPTHKKHLKAIAEELKVDSRDKEFLAYANTLTAEEWGAQSLDDHIRAFLQPAPAPLAAPPAEFLEVEFKGKEYLVDPETKFVYAASTSGTVRERDHLGVVGTLEFADMEIE